MSAGDERLPPGDFLTRCPDPRCGVPMVVRDPQVGARLELQCCHVVCVVVAANVYAVGLALVGDEREEG